MSARANRFRSGYSITLTFSPKSANTTATLYDDSGESIAMVTSDSTDEAVTLIGYRLDEIVDAYEAERDAEDREPYEDDRKNGVSESQFMYRIP